MELEGQVDGSRVASSETQEPWADAGSAKNEVLRSESQWVLRLTFSLNPTNQPPLPTRRHSQVFDAFLSEMTSLSDNSSASAAHVTTDQGKPSTSGGAASESTDEEIRPKLGHLTGLALVRNLMRDNGRYFYK